MCEPNKYCPLSAPVYRGCDIHKDLPEAACLKRGCYWDGAECAEPLLRVQGRHGLVMGIDTGSSFTVWAPGAGPCTPARARAARKCNTAECTTLHYGSGPVKVVPAGGASSDQYCAGHLFRQDQDGLIGVTPVKETEPRAVYSFMNKVIENNPSDHLLVVDKANGTVCIGRNCRTRPPGAPGVETRRAHASTPIIEHSEDQLFLLDTGSTTTHDITDRIRAHNPDLTHRVCIVGNAQIQYLEVRPGTLRYEITKDACAA